MDQELHRTKDTLASLRIIFLHSHLIEDTRHNDRQLMTQNLSVRFGFVTAHTGIEGNELADKLANAAAEDIGELNVVYNRIPIATIGTELKKKEVRKWQ